jgi:hypothetical protein
MPLRRYSQTLSTSPMIQRFIKDEIFSVIFTSSRSSVRDEQFCSLIGPMPVVFKVQPMGPGVLLSQIVSEYGKVLA